MQDQSEMSKEHVELNTKNIPKKFAPSSLPTIAQNAVFKPSFTIPSDYRLVKGYEFNKGIDYEELTKSFATMGHQATNFAEAISQINSMIEMRYKPIANDEYIDVEEQDEFIRVKSNLTIFLAYTSNMVTSGNREIIRFLVEHNYVDCIVTTAGGIEEDFIKCLAPTLVGTFQTDDRELRQLGINRAGNLFIPNQNYCLFENWLTPILDAMLLEQNTKEMKWTPSKMIRRLGEEINNKQSIYYWAAVNKIPVFSPALTDGSLGDMIYFHSFRNPGLILDIVDDLRRLNTMSIRSKNTGMIVLGGGLVKHHICNANLMRNGADFSVFINTAVEYDGSDSGARPEEAISWGKIKTQSSPVKIFADASIIFPLLVAQTFAKHHQQKSNISNN